MGLTALFFVEADKATEREETVMVGPFCSIMRIKHVCNPCARYSNLVVKCLISEILL